MNNKTIYKNAKFYSMDEKTPNFSYLVVENSRITYIGDKEIYEISENDQVIDLDNKTVFPAFFESHTHAPGLAYDTLFNVNLYSALTEKETIEMISDFVEKHPEKSSYYGRGFNTCLFQGIEGVIGPRKERLDNICKDKPIILSDWGGNCQWLNSKAIENYNITADRECPPGGEIQLNPETGEVWGIIRNEARIHVPYQEFTEEENYTAMKYFQNTLLRYGYTSIFALRPPGTVEPRTTLFDAFKTLEDKGELKLHIKGATDIDPVGDIDLQIETMKEIRNRVASPLIELTTAKFFLDGVVEGLDGYLTEPYTTEAGKGDKFTGKLFWDKDKLTYAFKRCMEEGFQIHCHTIGDGAVHDGLDAIERAVELVGDGDYRSSFTHFQLVMKEDIKRMAKLNIIANVQTYWHFKSPVMYPLEEKLLGANRAEKEYPLGSFVNEGVTIVASSDYPVTSDPNPFHAIEVGVTRNLYNASSYGINDISDMDDIKYLLNKDERVSLTDMLKAYTINAAYNQFLENDLGSLEVGKLADFIVLDKDPYEVDPIELEKIKVISTYFGGEEVC